MALGGLASPRRKHAWLLFFSLASLFAQPAVASSITIEGNFTFELTKGNEITFCSATGVKTAVALSIAELSTLEIPDETVIALTCSVTFNNGQQSIEWDYIIPMPAASTVTDEEVLEIMNADTAKASFQDKVNAQLVISAKQYAISVFRFSSVISVTASTAAPSESDGVDVTLIATSAACGSVFLVCAVVCGAFCTWRKASERMRLASMRKTKEPQVLNIGDRNDNLNDLKFRGKPVPNVCSLTFEEMQEMERQEAGELSKIEELVYHFFPPTLLPLIEARGLRASQVGQGGGGLSVSTHGPSKFAWSKEGGGDFRETVGRSLWGEKFKDVMRDGPAADKIDAIAFVKIPKQWQCTGVPGRADIRIVPKELLMVGHGGDFYLTPDRLKKVYFLFNPKTEEDRYNKKKAEQEAKESAMKKEDTKRGMESAGNSDNKAMLAPIQVGKSQTSGGARE